MSFILKQFFSVYYMFKLFHTDIVSPSKTREIRLPAEKSTNCTDNYLRSVVVSSFMYTSITFLSIGQSESLTLACKRGLRRMTWSLANHKTEFQLGHQTTVAWWRRTLAEWNGQEARVFLCMPSCNEISLVYAAYTLDTSCNSVVVGIGLGATGCCRCRKLPWQWVTRDIQLQVEIEWWLLHGRRFIMIIYCCEELCDVFITFLYFYYI